MAHDPSICPQCGNEQSPFHKKELDLAAISSEASEKEALRRDWIDLEELEEMVYGAALPAPEVDPEVAEIVGEIDEEFPWKPKPMGMRKQPNREALRHSLYVLGWRHTPLRTLYNDEGQRRELWTRRLSWEELAHEEVRTSRTSTDLRQVLAEFLGTDVVRTQFSLNTELRKKQRTKILRHMVQVKHPQWAGGVSRATGLSVSVCSLLLSFLVGEGKLVRFSYNRNGSDAVYVHWKYARDFEHIPVEEFEEVGDLDDIDVYEKVSKMLEGHTAIEDSLLRRAFPNVPKWVLQGVMSQTGWRLRRLARAPHWLSKAHPQYTSQHLKTHQEPEVPTEFDEDLYEEVESETIVVDESSSKKTTRPEPDPENPETGKILELLLDGGMFHAREIAKATAIPTRRVNVLLVGLVETGRVMKFPMGKTEAYVAR